MFNFLKGKNRKSKAFVFIDYEHWFYALNNNFDMKPDIKRFYNELSSRFDIESFYVFGDFSKAPIKYEVDKIREVTTNIIDSQNTSSYAKKDFTDFIMLDSIYRSVGDSKKVSTYVLFTGDGHFSSVAGYLRNIKKKKLIVYGVTGSVSTLLKSIADECYELPSINQDRIQYYRMIISNFEYLSKANKKVNATFGTTVKAVAKHNNCAEDDIIEALKDLIDMEVIVKQFAQVGKKKITVLAIDWQKAMKEGLWTLNREE